MACPNNINIVTISGLNNYFCGAVRRRMMSKLSKYNET